MRTTVTLERDVEQLLREAMHCSRRSFKATVNAAIRAGLEEKPMKRRQAPFVVEARPLDLRAGLDPAGLNKLADDLQVDAFLQQNHDSKKP
jgi:hypothetical protein